MPNLAPSPTSNLIKEHAYLLSLHMNVNIKENVKILKRICGSKEHIIEMERADLV